jgi:hypothetical protein
MPRYFFNLIDGASVIPDEEGTELAGLEEARVEAIESAREILSDDARDGIGAGDQKFDVTDESGTTVLTVAFADAFMPRRSS